MPSNRLQIVVLGLVVLTGALPAARAQNPPAGQQQGLPAPAGPPADSGQQRRIFRGNAVFGRIQSISPTEMKLAAPDGSTVTVHLSSKTVFRIEQQPAKLEDFKVGTSVFVRGTKTGDYTWDAELVAVRTGPPPMTQSFGRDFVVGTVKSIQETRITILRLDGVTQTVEVDENTSLMKHRESITLADIHPGDAVAVRGETKDGAFLPRTVNLLDPEQLERMKQFIGAGGAPPAGAPPPTEKKPDPGTKPPQGPR
jgi:hypothetical protein